MFESSNVENTSQVVLHETMMFAKATALRGISLEIVTHHHMHKYESVEGVGFRSLTSQLIFQRVQSCLSEATLPV